MSDGADKEFPAIGLDVKPGREHLTAKTMQAFEHVFQHHLSDADWFMKADDDTYVIVENLRYMLSAYNSSKPLYFGQQFKALVAQGYMSGGAGYVLSKEALLRFGRRPTDLCAKDHGAEDVEMGRCLERLGVKVADSRDALGRTRFHCLSPHDHIHGKYPAWYYTHDKHGGVLQASGANTHFGSANFGVLENLAAAMLVGVVLNVDVFYYDHYDNDGDDDDDDDDDANDDDHDNDNDDRQR